MPTAAGGTTSEAEPAEGRQVSDRVSERRRAAALARHYREQEDLTIAEIARRLGRAEATVKAYLYDPSDANKRPTAPGATVWALGVMQGRRSANDSSALAATARGRRPHCPICPGDGSFERRYSGPGTAPNSCSGRLMSRSPSSSTWYLCTGWASAARRSLLSFVRSGSIERHESAIVGYRIAAEAAMRLLAV